MMNQLSVEINKLRQGNFQDYVSFYNLTCNYVYKLITDVIKDKAIADQIMVSTYDNIYQTINALTDNRLFFRWAGQIATSECVKYMSSTGSMEPEFFQWEASYAYDDIFQDKDAFIGENVLVDMEIQRLIQETIDTFPAIYKIILQYFYYEGISIKEISDKLGLNEVEVRKAVSYIKGKLMDIANSVPADNNTKIYSLAHMPLLWIAFKQILDYATLGMVTGITVGTGVAAVVAGQAVAGGAMAGTGQAVAGGAVAGAGQAVAGGAVAGAGQAVAGGAVAGAGQAVVGGATAGSGQAVGGAAAGQAVGVTTAGVGQGTGGVASITGVGQTMSGVTAGSAVAGSAVAGSGVATGLLATVGGKIVAGIVATTLLAVGGVAVHHAVTKDDEKDNNITTEQVTEEYSVVATASDADAVEITEEATEETSVEEKLVIEVVDGFCEIKTGDIYSDTSIHCYHIPAVNVNGKALDINQDIYNELYGILEEDNIFVNKEGSLDKMVYHWAQKENVVSVLVMTTNMHYNHTLYYTYNVNCATGEYMTIGDMCQLYGITEEEFYSKVKAKMEKYFDEREEELGEAAHLVEPFQTAREDSLSEDNIRAAMPYISPEGDLCVVIWYYWIAGAGDYPTLFNLTGDTAPTYPECNINHQDENSSSMSKDIKEFNGHYYQLIEVDKTWDEAVSYCQELGGYMANISSDEENEFLYQMLMDSPYIDAYFGYTDVQEEGIWTWVNGEENSYTKWEEGEPNDQYGAEHYAMFYHLFDDAYWNDEKFDESTKVIICEWNSIEDIK